MEGKLNPRSYQSIRQAIREKRYKGRGQLLREMHNAFRKKGDYASGTGSILEQGEGSLLLDLTLVPLPEDELSPTMKVEPLSG